MKIDFEDNDLIVFLCNERVKNIDFFNKAELDNYFKDLFLKLNDIYCLDLIGSYEIELFIDSDCGIILRICEDDIDYYGSIIDISVSISKCNKFIFKLNGSIGDLLEKCELFIFNDDLYIIPLNFNYLEYGILLENSEIVYGKKYYEIKKHCKKISDYRIVDKII